MSKITKNDYTLYGFLLSVSTVGIVSIVSIDSANIIEEM